jgi:large subunit ribosomal protein L13
MYLMGKHRPGYVPHLLSGDFVVVTNASKVRTSGKKQFQKVYLRHNQQPGHLKKVPYLSEVSAHPDRVVAHAVKGMLPKNKLADRLLTRLKVYSGAEHPHAAQVTGSERAAEARLKAASEPAPEPAMTTPAQAEATVTPAAPVAEAPRAPRRKAAPASPVATAEAPVVRRPRAPGAKPRKPAQDKEKS